MRMSTRLPDIARATTASHGMFSGGGPVLAMVSGGADSVAAALARIPRDRLTDATGLNSLLRQVGASIGLAVFATLLERYGWRARAVLSAEVLPDRPEVQERLAQLAAGLVQRGFDPVSAKTAAMASALIDMEPGNMAVVGHEISHFLLWIMFAV